MKQIAFSALTLLVGQQEGNNPACKTEWWGDGVVVCLQRGADWHMSQLKPLTLIVSCSSKIQIGFTFLVPAHLGSPGQRAIKRVCCGCVLQQLLDTATSLVTPPQIRQQNIVSVLFVCPALNIRNCNSDLRQIFVHVTNRRGSVFLCRRCDMLCTSGFMHDVMLAHNGH